MEEERKEPTLEELKADRLFLYHLKKLLEHFGGFVYHRAEHCSTNEFKLILFDREYTFFNNHIDSGELSGWIEKLSVKIKFQELLEEQKKAEKNED